jgi:hypothetical protein
MRRPAPSWLPSLLVALGAVAACAWAAATVPLMGDYGHELRPAVSALLAGDLAGFAAAAPVYAGSVWPRVPFAWLADATGAGDLGVYRAGTLACLLVLAGLAVRLELTMRRSGRPALDRAGVVAVLLLAPVVLRALRDGHPEDVLAGTLAAGGVLLALRDRPALAGAALGLAAASKPWAVLAFLPALAAAPGRRALLTLAAGAAGALAVLPILALTGDRLAAQAAGATGTGRIFHAQQLFWPLREAHPNGGLTGPDWLAPLTHPLIVALAAPLTGLWAVRRRRIGAPAHDALLLLALLLALRCVLDPWNNAYYAVPLVIALAAWEALAGRGLPVLALAVTALTWLSFERVPDLAAGDGVAAFYLAWSLPLVAVLARRLWTGPPVARQATSSATAASTSLSPS